MSRIFTLVACATLSLAALMAGPNLTMAAQTGWESGQGLLVSLAGLGLAVIFSCLLAEMLADRNRGRR